LWPDVSLTQTETELVGAGGGCAWHCRVDGRLQSDQMNDWMMKKNDVLVACQLQTTSQTETTTKNSKSLKTSHLMARVCTSVGPKVGLLALS